jgi:hypothetical protein
MFTPRSALFLSLALLASACGESKATVLKPTTQKKPPQTTTQPPPTTEVVDAGAPPTCTADTCDAGVPPQPTDLPPTLTITDPMTNARISTGAVSVSGSASDDHDGLKVELSIDGTNWTPATVSSGAFSGTLVLPSVDDDHLSLQVRATDAAGHVLNSFQPIEVDNVAPTASIDPVSPAPAAAWLAGVAIHGKAADTTLTNVTVDLDDGRGPQTVPTTNGTWSATFKATGTEDFVAKTVRAVASDRFGHKTTVQQTFHVDVVAPRIAVTSPATNAKFNASSFASSGAVRVNFTLQDGDPAAYANQEGQTVHLTNVLDVQTSPSDDGKRYEFLLEAHDSSGNVGSTTVTFYVDRLPPFVARLAPAEGAITSDASAVVTFNEAVQIASGGFSASPALSGAFTAAGQQFTFNLAGGSADTAYTVSIPAVVDGFGNAAPAQPAWHFVTKPLLPQNGLVIANGVTNFSAATDEDGVLTVMATQGNLAARSYRFDSHSGAMVVGPQVAITATGALQADAFSHRLATGAAERISGTRYTDASNVSHVDWWLNGSHMTTPNQESALIATPALDGEGTNLGAVGFLHSNVSYDRSGRSSVALAIRADHVAAVDGRFEAVQVDDFGFSRQTFYCSQPFANAAPVCDMAPSLSQYGFSATPRYSHAITKNCSFHAYNDANGGRSLFIEPFIQGCKIGSCPTTKTLNYPASEELQLASATSTVAVEAWRVSSGVVVAEITPDASCNPNRTLAAQLFANDVVAFRPVRIGGKPALVWLDLNQVLRLFVP